MEKGKCTYIHSNKHVFKNEAPYNNNNNAFKAFGYEERLVIEEREEKKTDLVEMV